MRLIYVKVFEFNNNYKLKLTLTNISDNRKTIDNEIIKYYTTLEEMKMFLNYFDYPPQYKKSKIFICYFSNNILLETLCSSNGSKSIANEKFIDKIDEYFTNYSLNYDLNINEYTLKNRQKYASIIMVPKKIKNHDLLFNKVANKKVNFSFDLICFQEYLNKYANFFKGKFNLFIQIDNDVWNFYEFLSGKLTKFVMLNELNADFPKLKDNIFKTIDKKYDEIIIDSDFKTYLDLSEKWKILNVIYSDYYERLRFIDEKKFVSL